jgi:transposase
MNRVARKYPGDREIHVILDNLKTHNNAEVAEWLEKHPNFAFHYTPRGSRGSSWINQIETWFGIITRQAIRRGSFKSLAQLIKRIDTYITHWNEDAEPFEWTATAASSMIVRRLPFMPAVAQPASPQVTAASAAAVPRIARANQMAVQQQSAATRPTYL